MSMQQLRGYSNHAPMQNGNSCPRYASAMPTNNQLYRAYGCGCSCTNCSRALTDKSMYHAKFTRAQGCSGCGSCSK